MNSKSKKVDRIKQLFIDVTKQMIIKESINGVSVRRVASEVGYSYTTIYNYFRDFNALLYEVKQVMIDDTITILNQKSANITFNTDGIKRLFKNYLGYFYENPNIFQFFYLYKIDTFEKAPDYSKYDFVEMYHRVFKTMVEEGKIKKEEVEIISKILIYAMHGLMSLSYSNNTEGNIEGIYHEIDQIVDFFINMR